MQKAVSGSRVKIHYTGTLDSGEIFDSSLEREPLEFVVDDGSMIKGFNDGVLNMELNEKKKIKIAPEEAYGEKRDDLILNVEREKIPSEIELFEGLQLQMPQPGGHPVIVTVTYFDEQKVILDANHTLAGESLNFEIELVEVK